MKKEGKKKMKGLLIFVIIISIISIFMVVQGFRCGAAVKDAKKRLETYNAQIVNLEYGKMTYVDKGSGEVIFSVHGIFGGYDQAFDTCKDFVDDYRIIAPSRFGYLGSDVLGKGTPKEQAFAYKMLLDELGIDKVFVLATSAGGTPAIRFVLDYPERVKGLILYCSALPPISKPNKVADYAGPPGFLCNNYAMFLMSPLFKPILGMESDTIYEMLPVSRRKEGIVLDSKITNLDMSRNFDDYDIESMNTPTIVLLSQDDKLVNYKEASESICRFKNLYKFISFENGGHLMEGHSEEVKTAVSDFIKKQENKN